MLDRSKVARALEAIIDGLFQDNSEAFSVARTAWDAITNDPDFFYKVMAAPNPPWPVPTWQGKLDQIFEVATSAQDYIAFSVDGSQIYPDRHMGYNCCLINIGGIIIRYGELGDQEQAVELLSDPFIFSVYDNRGSISTDFVNALRHELELSVGVSVGKGIMHDGLQRPFVVLFDGSLIFWHLEAQHGLKEQFLKKYLDCLSAAQDELIPFVGYISAPKSKEIVNLLRLHLSDFNPERTASYESINSVNDAHIISFFVPPFHRTAVFKNNSSIAQWYPASVAPFFFYLHVDDEIARVELPAWLAADQKKVDLIASLILDQVRKGSGYPLVIAEAHQQAVVKRDDREFFYQLLERCALQRGKSTGSRSLKLQKKLRMSV
jgi:NurA domain